MIRSGVTTAVLGAALAAAGCQTRNFEYTTGGHGDAGARDLSVAIDRPDTSRDLIIDRPVADGAIDRVVDVAREACTADFMTDPGNCGMCGHVCVAEHAVPLCVGGQCTPGECLPGFLNLNGRADDGCEYGCTVTQGGNELCDGLDNDCDGQTDETFDLMTDLGNCGACGRACAFLNAGASCAAGACVLGACKAGFRDANNRAQDGCECAETNNGVEVCDGFDNDCNGAVDDVPASGFVSDSQHCGACARNCTALPHAATTCMNSACVILSCAFGWADRDGNADNGCEQACPGGFPGAVEVCDGVDNDCDGLTDAADDNLVGVANFCQQRGECAGSQPACAGGAWVCNYKASVEITAPNQIVGNETRCDGLDNDCDGCVDESFPQVGLSPAAAGGSCTASAAQACTDSGVGACQGRGHYVCNSARTGVTCNVTAPGAAPAAELCDGLDNDCDTIIDNADPNDPRRVREPMVAVSGGGLAGTVYVYAYEASRPDATGAAAGQSAARACSRPGVLPWTNLTHAQADAACKAAGKRLCSEAEWQRACQTAGTPACAWSSSPGCTSAAAVACNTDEHDGDAAAAGDQDRLLATATLSTCYADWGAAGKIYDLTGNAKEWTLARSPGVNPARGGAYDNILDGATCTFAFTAVGNTFQYGNTGFRCCSDVAP